MSLAKMDSAPSSSVVGLHGLNTSGLGIHHHLIANSEASLLRISSHSNGTNTDRRSFVPRIPPLGIRIYFLYILYLFPSSSPSIILIFFIVLQAELDPQKNTVQNLR